MGLSEVSEFGEFWGFHIRDAPPIHDSGSREGRGSPPEEADLEGLHAPAPLWSPVLPRALQRVGASTWC